MECISFEQTNFDQLRVRTEGGDGAKGGAIVWGGGGGRGGDVLVGCAELLWADDAPELAAEGPCRRGAEGVGGSRLGRGGCPHDEAAGGRSAGGRPFSAPTPHLLQVHPP